MTAAVTIIIPTFNVAPYIERAIASALGQQNVAVEVVVVDDCSTDATWDIVTRLTDPRLRCFRLSHNQGPAAARNAALISVTTPWVAILDGDDAYHPDRLAPMLWHAQTKPADIVVDNLRVYHETDATESLMFPAGWIPPSGMLDLATFIRGNLSSFGGYSLGYLKPVFATDFLRRHQLAYDPEVPIGEDYILLAEALACGARCAIVPTAGYRYTKRIGSISYRLRPDDVMRLTAANLKLWNRRRLDPSAAQAQQSYMDNLHETLAFTRLVAGMKQGDAKAIGAAIWMHPTALRHLWRPVWARVQRAAHRHGKALPPMPYQSANR